MVKQISSFKLRAKINAGIANMVWVIPIYKQIICLPMSAIESRIRRMRRTRKALLKDKCV